MNILTLDKSNLWPSVVAKSNQATQSGDIHKETGIIKSYQDNCLPFYFRVIPGLAHKPHYENLDKAVYLSLDPFKQTPPSLLIGHIGDHHQLLLCKFSVAEYHLVIATIQFEQQGQQLSLADLTAMHMLVTSQRGVAIYNGGVNAGCSQLHKHMQFIPVAEFGPIALDQLIDQYKEQALPFQISTLPFRHLITRLSGHEQPAEIEQIYLYMLNKLNLYTQEGQDTAHNTLLTARWLFIVPRSSARFSGIHINAFGFYGLFFPKDQAMQDTLTKAGPLTILRSIATT